MGWQGRGIFAMPFSPLAKTFVMIPFGYNADRASLHWNNWSY